LFNKWCIKVYDKIYDYKIGSVVRDQVIVNRTNLKPDGSEPITEEYSYLIYDNIKDDDGYINNNKILVNFYDRDDNSIPDHPDSFGLIVSGVTSYIFFEKFVDSGNFPRYQWIDRDNFIITDDYNSLVLDDYLENQLFYDYSIDTFFKLVSDELIEVEDTYLAKYGRDGINFEHTHYALNNRRIDPSASNIIELYILTQNYDTSFRAWLSNGQIGSMPQPPSSDELSISYGSLYNYKSISDEIVFSPVKYRTLFGTTSDTKFQATFKVIKNSSTVISDNEVKTKIISFINEYFTLGNFDFGDSFLLVSVLKIFGRREEFGLEILVIIPLLL